MLVKGSQMETLISPQGLSEYLDIPLGTIYQWNYRHVGPPAHRVGRHLRYRMCDVQAWLDKNTVEAR